MLPSRPITEKQSKSLGSRECPYVDTWSTYGDHGLHKLDLVNRVYTRLLSKRDPSQPVKGGHDSKIVAMAHRSGLSTVRATFFNGATHKPDSNLFKIWRTTCARVSSAPRATRLQPPVGAAHPALLAVAPNCRPDGRPRSPERSSTGYPRRGRPGPRRRIAHAPRRAGPAAEP